MINFFDHGHEARAVLGAVPADLLPVVEKRYSAMAYRFGGVTDSELLDLIQDVTDYSPCLPVCSVETYENSRSDYRNLDERETTGSPYFGM